MDTASACPELERRKAISQLAAQLSIADHRVMIRQGHHWLAVQISMPAGGSNHPACSRGSDEGGRCIDSVAWP